MSTWYERVVFYHIYPLGMTGAPKNNLEPGITNRFDELKAWIPHMKDLGFGAVYIGPLFESSTHGYDTIDYRLVDRRLGDNGDFKEYTEICHQNNIQVVVDGVFNHTGRDFFAFQDIRNKGEASPYKNWYKGVNFGWGSPLGDAFTYDAWQGHYELPCLNLQHPEVCQYLFDTVQFWVSEFNIDGIRLDCANVLDFRFMSSLRAVTSRMKPDFWLMGEVIHGDYSRWVNRSMLDSVTNYELHKSLYSGLNDHNFFEIAHNVKRLEAIGRCLYTFLDNHDENRIASKLNNRTHLPLAYLLLLTLPGIPSVYYGSEWGIEGLRSNTSDETLRPCIRADEIKEKADALTGMIRQLTHIHNTCPEFHHGHYQELLLTNHHYVFARRCEDSAVIVAANCGDSSVTLRLSLPCQGTKAVNLFDNTVLPITDRILTVDLSGNQGAIYKISEV